MSQALWPWRSWSAAGSKAARLVSLRSPLRPRGARTSRTRCRPAIQFVVLGFTSVGGGADTRGAKISVIGGGYLSAGLRGGAAAAGFGAEILERMSFSAVSRLAVLRAIGAGP